MINSPAFEKIRKEISKNYGDSLRQGGVSDKRRLPTGVFNIDYSIRGGLPINRITILYGHKSCYKTYLALKAIKSYQSRCNFCFEIISQCECGGKFEFGDKSNLLIISNPMIVVYIDTEHALDEDHAARLGVDMENLQVFDPPYGEAACEYAEKFSQVPEVGLIIVDSLAGLVPEKELESGYFDKVAQSLRARLIARMYRALITHLRRGTGYPPRLAVAINHLLPNRDGYGDILPGGETQKYLSSVALRTQVTRKQYINVTKKGEDEIEEENDESEESKRSKRKFIEEEETKIRKQPVKFVVEHSKVSPDLIRGEFEVFLGEEDGVKFGDTNDFRVVYNRAEKLGLLENDGNLVENYKTMRNIWIKDELVYERIKKMVIESAVQNIKEFAHDKTKVLS